MTTIIVDGHEDIAFNALAAGRDYRQSAATLRARERDVPDLLDRLGLATLGLAEWRAGRIAIIFATIFVEPERSSFSKGWGPRYSTAQEADALARQQLAVYERLITAGPPFRMIRTAADLEAVLATWSGNRTGDIGLVLLMENADAIRDPDELDSWHDLGLRIIGPAWMASRYCGGTSEPGPLTDAGRQLLDRMARRQMVLDTSHMADAACFEAVERYRGPIIASHSNPRRFVSGDRHLSDAMIRAIVASDGVIGQVPFNAFLVDGWRRRGGRKAAADVLTFVRGIDHVCEIAGSTRHVAFGSDLDGGFGAESTPAGIDTVADLQRVLEALSQQGYSDSAIDEIAHGNWLRMIRRALV